MSQSIKAILISRAEELTARISMLKAGCECFKDELLRIAQDELNGLNKLLAGQELT